MGTMPGHVASVVRPSPARRRRPPVAFWLGLGGGLLAVLVIVFLATRKEEPGFTLDSGAGPFARWVKVTNQEKVPLVVQRLVINGEALGRRGEYKGNNVVAIDPRRSMPATLQIGEGEYFVYDRQPDYTRDVVYIDIDTNRGTFQYRDGQLK